MTSLFLRQFAESVLNQLIIQNLIELESGSEPQVVERLAVALARAKDQSLISVMAKALIDAEGVQELYADDQQLKGLVTDLGLTR